MLHETPIHLPPRCLSTYALASILSFRNTNSRIATHLHIMAPRLPHSKLQFIRDIIQSQSLTTSQFADVAECSEHTIKNIRRNLRQFGSQSINQSIKVRLTCCSLTSCVMTMQALHPTEARTRPNARAGIT